MVFRKVTKVGNSLGITFPAEMLKKANITLGDDIIYFSPNQVITINPNTLVFSK